MRKYKVLNNQKFHINEYSIIPIRDKDMYEIMKWRNEQIYHLRQNNILTVKDQENYFSEVVSNLFKMNEPNQLLFSFLEKEICIGYGGLVHINWIDKYAEISFVMNTSLEKDFFHKFWLIFLGLIEKVAFKELGLNKIFVYAFDVRSKLYEVLIDARFIKEARLKKHHKFKNEFIDVLIYSKFKKNESTNSN